MQNTYEIKGKRHQLMALQDYLRKRGIYTSRYSYLTGKLIVWLSSRSTHELIILQDGCQANSLSYQTKNN